VRLEGHDLRVDGRELAIVRGDITRVPADAIVNAANSALVGGGGVDGAIHRAGGPAIMADIEDRYGRDRHCPTGGAVISIAGDLPATWVIHAVGPIWRGGSNEESELLASAYRTAMRLADAAGARSITLPAISCGIYGYPLDAGAEVALTTVAGGLRDAAGLTRATFVLFSDETKTVFERTLERLRGGALGP
jgi:O-acetyl-ADP-ribose deacetylase (regulator of RNase III)